MSKNEIELRAESIMSLLSQKSKLSLTEISQRINCKELNILLALGLLVKENKVHISEKENGIFIESTHVLSNIYY